MKINIKATMNEIDQLWSVYTMTADEIEFVGHCKLVDVLKTPDVRGIPQFERGKQYQIEVTSVHNNAAEARIAASKLTTQLNRPKLNQSMALTRHCPIQCVETGQQWDSATDCVKQQGIKGSALSNHLNNKPGHRTIRGLTYRRVPLNRPDLHRNEEYDPTPKWFSTGDPMTGEIELSQTPDRSKNVIASGDYSAVKFKTYMWMQENSTPQQIARFVTDYGMY